MHMQESIANDKSFGVFSIKAHLWILYQDIISSWVPSTPHPLFKGIYRPLYGCDARDIVPCRKSVLLLF